MTNPKDIVRRAFEDHFNRKNPAAVDAVYAPTAVMHTPDGTMTGRDGMNALMQAYASAFPDFVLTIDDMVAEGDRVAVRYSFSGTHRGAIAGIPATGKRVSLGGNLGIYRVAGGQIVEGYGSWDRYALMEQVGALPPAGAQPA